MAGSGKIYDASAKWNIATTYNVTACRYNVTAAENHTVFTSSGANHHITYVLPPASTGLEYSFHNTGYAIDGRKMAIETTAGDYIVAPFQQDSQNYVQVWSTGINNVITLYARDGTYWQHTGHARGPTGPAQFHPHATYNTTRTIW